MAEEETARIEKKSSSFRHYLNFTIQQLFLILVVVVYTVGGAVIFRILERPTDIVQRQTLIDDLEWTISKLYELSRDPQVTEERWSQELIVRMSILSPLMCNKKIWIDIKEKTIKSHWTDLTSTSSFCFSLMTATPTGEIQPSTYNGKLFFIVFCVIGIPLCLAALRELGIRTTEGLQVIIFYLEYRYYGMRVSDHSEREGTSLATRHRRFKHRHELITVAHGSKPLPGKTAEIYDKVQPKKPLPRNWRDVQVPSLLVITMWLIYLFVLAICMSMFEGWRYLESIYFVALTVITCPMGDYIPTHTPKALYTLFIAISLLLFSLCFNVCYTRVVDTVKNLFGLKLFTSEENKEVEK